MLAEKYKPQSLKEFVGQKNAVHAFLAFMKTKPKKGLLLYGPSGSGKTALVEAYAKEKNMELVQMNASDVRGEEEISHMLGNASKQASLFNRRKIILVDEIDGISGREDRSGVPAIIELIKESSFPVVLIANNPWNQKLRPLRQYCEFVEFKRLSSTEVEKKLKQIASVEKIHANLVAIAKKSRGDLRSAINDLEFLSSDEREVGKNIFEFLRELFKSKSARFSIDDVDVDPETIFRWIESNIPNEYEDPVEIARAYEALSRADVFFSRIRSRQNWRLFSYAIDLMTGGVAVAKKGVYKKFTHYRYPKFARAERGKLFQMSKSLHCSTKKFKKEYLPFIDAMAKTQ